MSRRIVLEFPTELPKEGFKDREALTKGKTVIVLEMLRKGKISQGKAAELLEMDRNSILDLMAKYDIPTADFSVEELLRQLEHAEKEGKK